MLIKSNAEIVKETKNEKKSGNIFVQALQR